MLLFAIFLKYSTKNDKYSTQNSVLSIREGSDQRKNHDVEKWAYIGAKSS